MTQKTNRPRIVIDINKHGIRRETNLDAQLNKKLKKKQKEENKSK